MGSCDEAGEGGRNRGDAGIRGSKTRIHTDSERKG